MQITLEGIKNQKQLAEKRIQELLQRELSNLYNAGVTVSSIDIETHTVVEVGREAKRLIVGAVKLKAYL